MDYLQEFLDFIQYQRGLSPNTQRGYAFDLSQYFQWLNSKGIDPTLVKVRDVGSFLISLRKTRVIRLRKSGFGYTDIVRCDGEFFLNS